MGSEGAALAGTAGPVLLRTESSRALENQGVLWQTFRTKFFKTRTDLRSLLNSAAYSWCDLDQRSFLRLLGLSVDVYKCGVNHACPVSLPGLFERTKTMKNSQWAWRTVIYNCKKLIIIPPQSFIWSRLVKVQDRIQCNTGIGCSRHCRLP